MSLEFGLELSLLLVVDRDLRQSWWRRPIPRMSLNNRVVHVVLQSNPEIVAPIPEIIPHSSPFFLLHLPLRGYRLFVNIQGAGHLPVSLFHCHSIQLTLPMLKAIRPDINQILKIKSLALHILPPVHRQGFVYLACHFMVHC